MALLHRSCGYPVAPMIDAGRQEVYAALYLPGSDAMPPARPERAGPPRDFLGDLPSGPILFCGDGARRYQELVEQLRAPGDVVDPEPCFLGTTLARWASGMVRSGAPWSLGALRPNYIRPPDAEGKPRN